MILPKNSFYLSSNLKFAEDSFKERKFWRLLYKEIMIGKRSQLHPTLLPRSQEANDTENLYHKIICLSILYNSPIHRIFLNSSHSFHSISRDTFITIKDWNILKHLGDVY